MMRAIVVSGIFGLMILPPVQAQSITDRVAAVRDGKVRFNYPARRGICGSGANSYSEHRTDNDDWEADCVAGPVRVVVTRTGGETTALRWYVGGRWRPGGASVTDLGSVGSLPAASLLVDIFRRHDDRVGRRALSAAGLADNDEIWPTVIAIARDGNQSNRSRRAAIEWLARSAGRTLRGESDGETDRARQQAIFALSQLPKNESVPRLVRIVETHADAPVRRQALFWLGQTGDERALPVIEEILRAPRG